MGMDIKKTRPAVGPVALKDDGVGSGIDRYIVRNLDGGVPRRRHAEGKGWLKVGDGGDTGVEVADQVAIIGDGITLRRTLPRQTKDQRRQQRQNPSARKEFFQEHLHTIDF